MTEPIVSADIDWNEAGMPVSRRYGDVYFSQHGGLAESRHVFLDGNNLPARFSEHSTFTVGETGFGSGLNFLALWQLWEKTAPKNARLCFFSAEKHPLSRENMAKIHALFPEIAVYGEQLRANLPLPVPGYHRLYFAGGRIQLTLMYGDALHMLEQQEARTNAWFLDGFAPRLNPELWSHELARQICRLSASGCSFATFSTSAQTKEALLQAGFAIEKTHGFGSKKYMLQGRLAGKAEPCQSPESATVIGGGLAGASAARALAIRGCNVTLCEQAAHVAAGASSNPSAIFYPGVTVGWQPLSQLYFMGFSHSLHLLKTVHAQQPVAHDLCGMLLFPKPREDSARQAKVLASMQPDASVFHAVNAAEATEISGISIASDGLFFPASGWVNVHQFTQSLLAHPRISCKTNTPINALSEPDLAHPQLLCNGLHATQMYPALHNSMHPVAGQVTAFTPSLRTQKLKTVLSYGGYLTPEIETVQHVGATYEKESMSAECSEQGQIYNLRKLSNFLGENMDVKAVGGWSGMRSVSKNRLPLVGPLESGVYASLAHASRGLLSCALSGEYIASLIYGDPLPIPRDIAQLLDPQRYNKPS